MTAGGVSRESIDGSLSGYAFAIGDRMQKVLHVIWLAVLSSVCSPGYGDFITFDPVSVSVATNTSLTGESRSYNINLNLPAFSSSIGVVNFVDIRQQHVLTTEGNSTATGGLFIPPSFIGNWSWAA